MENRNKAEKSSSNDSSLTAKEKNGIMTGALAVGLAFALAPLMMLFGKCFCNKNEDGLDAATVKSPPPESAQPVDGRMQMQRQMMQESSKQVVQESSRNVAAAVYMPQNTIS